MAPCAVWGGRRPHFRRPRRDSLTSSSLAVRRRSLQCAARPHCPSLAPARAPWVPLARLQAIRTCSPDLARLLSVLPGARARREAALYHPQQVPHLRAANGRRLRRLGRVDSCDPSRGSSHRRPRGSALASPRCPRSRCPQDSLHGMGGGRFGSRRSVAVRFGDAVGDASESGVEAHRTAY